VNIFLGGLSRGSFRLFGELLREIVDGRRKILLEQVAELLFDLRLQETLNRHDAVEGGTDKDGFEGVVFEDEGDAFDLIYHQEDDATHFEVADPEKHGDDEWLVSCQDAAPSIGWVISLFDVHWVGLCIVCDRSVSDWHPRWLGERRRVFFQAGHT
jgi:hypothetical protein